MPHHYDDFPVFVSIFPAVTAVREHAAAVAVVAAYIWICSFIVYTLHFAIPQKLFKQC